MASVEVLSAKIAHADDATLEPTNKHEETTEEAVRNPPPPPPPPPSEKKQTDTDSETKESNGVAPETETLAIAMETKAVIATEPTMEKKCAGASNKVVPEPDEEKIEDTAEVAPAVGEKKDEEKEKEAEEEEEKVPSQAKVEKKEE